MQRTGSNVVMAGVGLLALVGVGCHSDGLVIPGSVEDASIPGLPLDAAVQSLDGGAGLDLAIAPLDFAATLPGCRRALFTPAAAPLTLPQPALGAVVVSDLDGDSRPDLVVPMWGNGGVQVGWGNGDGTFTLPLAVSTGANPVNSATVGDLNLDGKLDLVVSLSGGDHLAVLLGQGGRAFARYVSYPRMGPNRYEAGVFAVADLFEDGMPDVLLGEGNSGGVGYSAGGGDGTLQPAVQLVQSTRPVHVADFDHDGHLDVLAFGEAVTLFQGDGRGGFKPNDVIARPLGASLPRSALAADFNGDGALDVAFVDFNSSRVGVAAGNGSLVFEAPRYTALGNNSWPALLVSGDFTGDGHVDLIVGEEMKRPAVLVGMGDGTFAAPVDLALPVSFSKAKLTAADLNGDGALDLAAVANQSRELTLLFNSCR